MGILIFAEATIESSRNLLKASIILMPIYLIMVYILIANRKEKKLDDLLFEGSICVIAINFTIITLLFLMYILSIL